jgi:hypothetical protein
VVSVLLAALLEGGIGVLAGALVLVGVLGVGRLRSRVAAERG